MSGSGTPPPRPGPRRRGGPRILAAAAAALLTVAGAWLWVGPGSGGHTLDGPLGVPTRWRAPAVPADLGDRPLEAASMAVWSGEAVVLVSADGRGYRRLAPVSGARGFRLSPDGRRLAWVGRDLRRDPEAALWIVRLADGAEAGWVGVRPPGERPFATSLDWSPDGSRLVVTGGDFTSPPTGGERVEPRLWDVDARTGAVHLRCACGAGVRSTAAGRLVQVPRSGGTDVGAPLPAGTGRLPALPPTLTGAPVVDPEGRRWAAPDADHGTTVTGADGVARPLPPAPDDDGPAAYGLLAWTGDGIWAVADGTAGTRVGLLDPDTGAFRVTTLVVPGNLPQDVPPLTVATGLAAGGAVVEVATPWWPEWVGGVLASLRFVLALTAVQAFSPGGLAVAAVVVGAVLAGRATAGRRRP